MIVWIDLMTAKFSISDVCMLVLFVFLSCAAAIASGGRVSRVVRAKSIQLGQAIQ